MYLLNVKLAVNRAILTSIPFGLFLISGIAGCGDKDSDEPKEEESPEEEVFEGVTFGGDPTECSGEAACVTGFISHGMRLTMEWDDQNAVYDVDGDTITFERTEFRDAQDFGDRFDTVFLKPLLGDADVSNYDIKLAPTVLRDNFAVDFEIYTEAANAVDTVNMEGEGNFLVTKIDPDPSVVPDGIAVRAVKTFRIEVAKAADADESVPEPRSPIICFEIYADFPTLDVASGETRKLGGLRNFTFSYLESPTLCDTDKVSSQAQSRSIPASTAGATQPTLP